MNPGLGDRTRTLAPLIVALVALAVYLPALGNGFAYDDVPLIQNDARVHGLGSIGLIFSSGYWGDGPLGLYRPITTLSFAIDWTLSSGWAAWFHFTNIALHALACALAAVLLMRLFAPAAALAGGLVFAVHPVHVEAVANVVGRGELLAAIFVLGACLLWTGGERGRDGSAPDGAAAGEGVSSVRSLWRALAVALCFAFGLASKESAAVLPLLLLLVDAAVGRIGPDLRGYVRANSGAYAMLAIVLAAYVALRYAALDTLEPAVLDPSLEVVAGSGRFWTALQAWPHYLRLLAFPVVLLADYGPGVIGPAPHVTPMALLGFAIAAACVGGGLWALASGHRRTAFALLWFAIAVLPVSNLIVPIGVLVAERTLYVPSLSAAIAAAGAVALVHDRRILAPRWVIAALAAVLLAAGARSVLRVPDWASTETVLTAQLRDRPDTYRAQWQLARYDAARGDTATALERYAAAIRIWPYRKKMMFEAADLAVATGRLADAHRLAEYSAARWPEDVDAQRTLAAIALDLGDTLTAGRAIRSGLALAPDDAMLLRMRRALAGSSSGGR